MEVRAVLYHSDDVDDELYVNALTRVSMESQSRIKRFYRREDACRTLIGELVVRLLLHESGRSQPAVFRKTPEGKPYIPHQDPANSLGFNTTHDNALVAVAVAPGEHRPPAYSIGVDVMKSEIPPHDTFTSFVEVFEEQLTAVEIALLTDPGVPLEERTRRFFWMWTLKEAYTKALGLGLGFDFKRVEFNPSEHVVKIDGVCPEGWRFMTFTVADGDSAVYLGVVAEFVGGKGSKVIDCSSSQPSWLKLENARNVLLRASDTLTALQN